jgi:hypothetical protein
MSRVYTREQFPEMLENMRREDAEIQRQIDEGLIEQAICEECGEENIREVMEISADNNKLICGDCSYCFEPYYHCRECVNLYCCEITRRCEINIKEDEVYCETCIIETNRFEICECKICKDIENEQISPK